jgi:hypothetical protein
MQAEAAACGIASKTRRARAGADAGSRPSILGGFPIAFGRHSQGVVMNRVLVAAALLLPLAAQAAWTPKPAPATQVTGGVVTGTVTDPAGDTFAAGPDATSMSATNDGTNLTIVLTFAGAIQPPPGNGSGNEVIGIIAMDLDQNPATSPLKGNSIDQFCPTQPSSFGPEVEISFPVPDTRASAALGGGYTVTYGANTVTLVIPNAALGDDGNVNLAAVIGNIPAPTDCIPDGSLLASGQGTPASIPALGEWSMLGLLLATAMLGLWFARPQGR